MNVFGLPNTHDPEYGSSNYVYGRINITHIIVCSDKIIDKESL